MRHPVKFSETPADIRYHPPGLGQDGREVLVAAGIDDEEIDQLIKQGVLQGTA
ncbi:hypothetical protein KFU94_55375 [Chloroflexi bacterium TSY]|nr:hypothetical protein [Chloroflexi bacterium TSY]